MLAEHVNIAIFAPRHFLKVSFKILEELFYPIGIELQVLLIIIVFPGDLLNNKLLVVENVN